MSLLLLFAGGTPAPATSASAIVEIGFTSYPTTPQASIAWTDVTTDVNGTITVTAGRSAELNSFQPSTCQFVLNNDTRKYDPRYTAGPHYGNLRPLRPVRVTVTTDTASHTVYVGYIQGWPQRYRHPEMSTVQISAIDGFGLLGLANLTDNNFTLNSSTLGVLDRNRLGGTDPFTTELSGARIGRLLDLAGWPAADRAIDTGQVFVTGNVQTGGALATLQAVTDVEFGQLYMSPAGQVVFEDRLHRLTSTRSTITRATFTDITSGNDRYDQVGYNDDYRTIINDARRTRTGGAEQAATDSASIGEFYRRVDSKTDLPALDDDQLLTLCQYLVGRYAQPSQRIENLDTAIVDPARLETVLGLHISDRVTVHRTPQNIGDPINADYLLEGYTLNLNILAGSNVSAGWSAYVSPVDTTHYFILDTDMLDVGVLVL